MERKKPSLVQTLLIVILLFTTFAGTLNLPPAIAFGALVLIMTLVTILYVNQRRVPEIPAGRYYPSSETSEEFEFPSRPRIGSWLAVPIILVAVAGIIAIWLSILPLFNHWL